MNEIWEGRFMLSHKERRQLSENKSSVAISPVLSQDRCTAHSSLHTPKARIKLPLLFCLRVNKLHTQNYGSQVAINNSSNLLLQLT